MDPSYYYDPQQVTYSNYPPGGGYYQEYPEQYMYYYNQASQQYWNPGQGRGRGRGQGHGDPEQYQSYDYYYNPQENVHQNNSYGASIDSRGTGRTRPSRRGYQSQRAERWDVREQRQLNSRREASDAVASGNGAGKQEKVKEKEAVDSNKNLNEEKSEKKTFSNPKSRSNADQMKKTGKGYGRNRDSDYESRGVVGEDTGRYPSRGYRGRGRETVNFRRGNAPNESYREERTYSQKDDRDSRSRGNKSRDVKSDFREKSRRSPRDSPTQLDENIKRPVSDDVRITGVTVDSKGIRLDDRRPSRGDRNDSSGKYRGRRYNLSGKKLTAEELETQRGSLIEQLCNNNYECMVCYDLIYREAAIWSCKGCYHIYHLKCIRKWASSPSAVVEGEEEGWRCPACQNVSKKFPGQYWCFCGKIRDPLYNRYETPHSCGEMCGKKRDENCPHPCNILCHPGPCPSCNATVTKKCECGKTKQTIKCSQSLSLKCDTACGLPLTCGNHDCQQVCHSGKCSSCEVEIKQTCHCGQKDRVVFCGTEESLYTSYTCEQVCNRILDCGNHRCEKTCHEGDCDVCQMHPDVVTHCPCGATELTTMATGGRRSSCIDPVPTCGQKCGKELPCGPEAKRHICQRECHEGDCTACDGEMPVTCRCGFFIKEVPCVEGVRYNDSNPLLCDKRCNKKRQCGRHKCNQLCCVEKEHKCEQICGRKLTCGLHRCDEPCHRGNCHTCWEVSFEELHCHCGTEILFPPVACGTKPPECRQLCKRQHPCDHPVQHRCHSDVECPPCTVLTRKWCQGGHELRNNIACHITDVSCGLSCNRPLPCQQHKCLRICHKGPCLEKEGEKCSQRCSTKREECGHPCGVVCHVGMPCPNTPCKAEIELKCPCGHRLERVICNMGGTNNKDTTQEYPKMTSSMLAGRIFGNQSIDITTLTKKTPRELECNEDCHRIERNKRIALALQIVNPDVTSKLGPPAYPQFLKDFAKLNPAFVASIEKALSDLVQNSKESKQPSRSHSFKPMKREQRRLIHELAEFYGCKTQSYDYEPNKSVVATAYKDKCWLPSATLTDVTQRELHPLGPRPIPLNSSEKEIRAAARALSKQSLTYLSSSVSQDDITKTKRVEKSGYIDYFDMTE